MFGRSVPLWRALVKDGAITEDEAAADPSGHAMDYVHVVLDVVKVGGQAQYRLSRQIQ